MKTTRPFYIKALWILAICLGLIFALFLAVFPVGRWWRFQRLGELPLDANYYFDWPVAQYTTWWGKPLDPKEFWKGRTIWLDGSASRDAHRRGRSYPPMPYEDPKLSGYSNKDQGGTSGGPDSGPLITFYSSYRERVFWNNFFKTHPKPPDDIEREQSQVADDFHYNWRDLSPEDTARLKASSRNDPLTFNYPAEAFTDDALYWNYVLRKRHEYEEEIERDKGLRQASHDDFLKGLDVDAKLITEPLTAEQKKAANAWKVKYLQRLHREKEYETYIDAYLKAWNLSRAEVLPEPSSQ